VIETGLLSKKKNNGLVITGVVGKRLNESIKIALYWIKSSFEKVNNLFLVKKNKIK